MGVTLPRSAESQRKSFEEACEGLPETHRSWVTALAAEARLGVSVLESLGASLTLISEWTSQGLLIRDGDARPLSLTRGSTEPAYVLPSGLRQLTLRKAQERGQLETVVLRCEQLLGRRSAARLSYKLQTGALVLRPGGAAQADPRVEAELRSSVLREFDAVWLQRTWGDKTVSICARILEQALPQLHDCGPLFHSLTTGTRTLGETQTLSMERPLSELLCLHALHRLDPVATDLHLQTVDVATRLGLMAVLRFQEGNEVLAQQLVDQCLAFSGTKLPVAHAFTPLLALLLVSRKQEAAISQALSWLGQRGAESAAKSAARGLRAYLKHQSEPEGQLRRINAHQIPKDATAWEELILGLTVYSFCNQDGTRKAWARRLAESGAVWLEAGYLWMGRQAFVLALALEGAAFSPGTLSPRAAALFPTSMQGLRPGPGDLCALLSVRQPWELGLAALDRLAVTALEPATRFRLEWYVTPHNGSVNKPGLEEYVSGRGWLPSRRVTLEEVLSLTDSLPEEDQRVLEAIGKGRQDRSGETQLGPEGDAASMMLLEPHEPGFPHAEALEAMIGHPRAKNGAAGGVPVEVVRGTCQIETVDEPEHLRIFVTPQDLGPGLNILREGEARLSVVRVSASMYEVLQTLPHNLCVPHAHAAQALAVLGRLAGGVSVKSRHLEAEQMRAALSVPCLRIVPALGAWLIELGVRPFGAEGRFFPPGTGLSTVNGIIEGRRVRTERDLAKERQACAAFVAACPMLLHTPKDVAAGDAKGKDAELPCWTFGGEEILPLLAEVRDCGLPCEFEWPQSPPFSLRGQITAAHLNGSLRSKKGWYIVSGSVHLDEVTSLSLAELSRMPSTVRGRFVRLPSGDFVEVEARVRRVLLALSGAPSPRGEPTQVRLGRARLASLTTLREDMNLDLDEDSARALDNFAEVEQREAEVPEDLRAELRDYQVAGYRWLSKLSSLGLGACLADDMGLGKTLQIIAYLLSRPPGERHLVVAPTSVCTNWLREITRFAPTLRAVESAGTGREQALSGLFSDEDPKDLKNAPHGLVVITSYTLLHEDRERLSEIEFDTVILDEAQFIKNARSLRAQAAFSLKARMHVAATGTPVENHLGDMWSLFHFLNPELLGAWGDFQAHFLKPVQRDGDHLAREQLRELVRPYLLRRTKDQVLRELPPLTTLRKEILLSKDDNLRYAALRREIHTKLYTRAGKQNNKLEVLAEITRLRRFCCHPRLIFPDAPLDSPKLDALLDLALELQENGHRALVFSQYVDFLELVRERLHETGIEYEYLDGSTPKAARQTRIDRFQEGNTPLFLISLKAGGLGLNLTAADYVVHLDPWWNPAVASQATDRAHRMGQERPVTVYEFVTKDTVEEDIMKLHQTKQHLADALLHGGEQVGNLSYEELLGWLSPAAD